MIYNCVGLGPYCELFSITECEHKTCSQGFEDPVCFDCFHLGVVFVDVGVQLLHAPDRVLLVRVVARFTPLDKLQTAHADRLKA